MRHFYVLRPILYYLFKWDFWKEGRGRKSEARPFTMHRSKPTHILHILPRVSVLLKVLHRRWKKRETIRKAVVRKIPFNVRVVVVVAGSESC